MKRIEIQWRVRGEQLSQRTTLEAEANPVNPTDSIESKFGEFLIQLANRKGYLIKTSDVEFFDNGG